MSHVTQSLMNRPFLHGYTFGVYGIPKPYKFPDVGDLDTVFSCERGTVLGFTFGLNGVMPTMPIFFNVSKEPLFSDPSVIVRRTARRLLRVDKVSCYLHIEFCWLKSGVLAVTTSEQARMYYSGSNWYPDSATDHIETRVFGVSDAQQLLCVAKRFQNHRYDMYNRTHRVSSMLPKELLEPPFRYTIIVKDVHCQSIPTALSHSFKNQKELVMLLDNVNSESCVSYESTLGYLYSALLSEFSRDTEDADAVWTDYCGSLRNSRAFGIYKTLLSRVDPTFGKASELFERLSKYEFLSSHGVSTRGRIQHLCAQLGIDSSSPGVDCVLTESDGNSSLTTKRNMDEADEYREKASFTVRSTSGSLTSNLSSPCSPVSCIDSAKDIIPEEFSTAEYSALSFPVKRKWTGQLEENFDLTKKSRNDDNSMTISPKIISSVVNIHSLLSDNDRYDCDEVGSKGPRQAVVNDGEIMFRNEPGVVSENSEKTETLSAESSSILGRKIGGEGTREIWKCSKCSIEIRGKWGNLKRHFVFKHENVRLFACGFGNCGRKFHNRENLKRHEDAVHEGRPFKCPYCPRNFKRQADIGEHVQKTHTGRTKILACETCGNCFAHRSSLKRHVRVIHHRQKRATTQVLT